MKLFKTKPFKEPYFQKLYKKIGITLMCCIAAIMIASLVCIYVLDNRETGVDILALVFLPLGALLGVGYLLMWLDKQGFTKPIPKNSNSQARKE